MTETLRKVFTFPKVAYTSNKHVNLPEVEMELSYKDGDTSKPCLSISGYIWNAKRTDWVIGGQCLDSMVYLDPLCSDKLFIELYRLWKKWHLNDLHLGTSKQEKAIKESNERFRSYDEQCEYLNKIGLLEDEGHKYGSSYLYREISENDLSIIKSLLSD